MSRTWMNESCLVFIYMYTFRYSGTKHGFIHTHTYMNVYIHINTRHDSFIHVRDMSHSERSMTLPNAAQRLQLEQYETRLVHIHICMKIYIHLRLRYDPFIHARDMTHSKCSMALSNAGSALTARAVRNKNHSCTHTANCR